jgi:hypothetical protein
MGIVRTGRFLLKQFVKRNTEYRKTTSSGKKTWSSIAAIPGINGIRSNSRPRDSAAPKRRSLSHQGTHEAWLYNNWHKPLVDEGVIYRPSWDFTAIGRCQILTACLGR